MDRIEAIAAQLGQPVADVAAWIECLSVWTAKGYTVEEAIAQNGKTLVGLMDRTNEGLSREYSIYSAPARALRDHLVSEVWDTVNGGRA